MFKKKIKNSLQVGKLSLNDTELTDSQAMQKTILDDSIKNN